MQGRRLAVTLTLCAVLGGCAWFDSLFGGGSGDTSSVDKPLPAAEPTALADAGERAARAPGSGPADAPQIALLPGYLADFEAGLSLGGGLDGAVYEVPEPAVALPPLPDRRPDRVPATSAAAPVAVVVPVALTSAATDRDAAFEAGARLAGTPLSDVIRASKTPTLTALAVPPGDEAYSLADALRDAQWRSDTARRLDALFQ